MFSKCQLNLAQSYGGIPLSHKCQIKCVNMQYDYVYMQLFHVFVCFKFYLPFEDFLNDKNIIKHIQI